MSRLLEIFLVICALVVLSPLLLLIALAIRIYDGSPIIFKQIRIGQNGAPFTLYKFRTMRESPNGSPLTLLNDSRITKVGHYLRKWRLDELPQLLNVVKGEMAIVGPRPESPELIALYDEDSKAFLQSLKPGLTSAASIVFLNESEILAREGSDLSIEEKYRDEILPTKLAIERSYYAKRTLVSDIKLILLTLKYLIDRKEH